MVLPLAASSHQYRNLIPALATRFHVIAPDYPGFGNSDMPDPATFPYTFDKLSEVIEAFLKDRGFDHYGLFVQDYGGPVGFRIVPRHPEALDWLIIQNTNAYEIGFTSAWDGFRTNVELYPKWQAFLRERQPKTIIFWGQQDLFFTPEGGEAYLKDLPKAEMHRLAAGHFAVEDSLNEIAEGMHRFYVDRVGARNR
jgi:pimeloyl-ACP methyl ester carboxylesterase